jgi:putative nucleotidyltransferase with HDIG domain
MNYIGLLRKVKVFAKKYCEKDLEDDLLWKNHVRLVRKFALKLAKIENADKQVVEIASLFHDIGKFQGRKEHNVVGFNLAKQFFKENPWNGKKEKLVLKCILKHRSKFSREDNEIEVKVIQSADMLGTLFDDEWQDYSRKNLKKKDLLLLYENALKKINLASAKVIAKKRIGDLKQLI